jgi:hypothetical protein
MRLDEEKLEALRSWGEKLRQTGGEESAAVGRAILMLVEEIDRLHIDLWHLRMQAGGGEPVANEESPAVEQPVALSLHARLQQMLRRDGGTAPSDAPSDTLPAQAWIESLRRQK